MNIPVTAVFLFLLYFLFTKALGFLSNYRLAKKTGLTVIVSPITPYTWLWQIVSRAFGPYLRSCLWYRAIDPTCVWHDGDRLHEQFGTCFIVVSPSHNVLCSNDVETIEHVLRKWRDFVKPDHMNGILGTLGQNVDTSNGDDWSRHRKLTAPCFNERASLTVWHEALRQSEALLAKWRGVHGKEIDSIIKDTGTLALNVVSAVAFRNHQADHPTEGHTLSLRESLGTVLSTSISPTLEGRIPWLQTLGLQKLLPTSAKRLLSAMSEFRKYLDEIADRERHKPQESANATKLNLISTLIKASQPVKSNDETLREPHLSENEVRGNIFIFIVGGLESTSATLSYAFALLTVHTDIQDWVVEEIRESLEQDTQDYAKVFCNLHRVLAVMYETLRLYGPSPPLARAHNIPKKSYTLPVSSKTSSSSPHPHSITLPGSTQMMLNSWACHTSPLHFSSPKKWDPKRWIDASGKFVHPTSGSGFYAWGAGPRICPGMKFSQVEFCAVLASVLSKVRVSVAINPYDDHGDTKDTRIRVNKEKDRILEVLRDSSAEPLLLHVRRGEDLRVRITER